MPQYEWPTAKSTTKPKNAAYWPRTLASQPCLAATQPTTITPRHRQNQAGGVGWTAKARQRAVFVVLGFFAGSAPTCSRARWIHAAASSGWSSMAAGRAR